MASPQSPIEDGGIDQIGDAQRIVVLRPLLAIRWTSICREALLPSSDWIRTEIRGANAVKVTLTSDVELTPGPETLLECVSLMEVRLHPGMIQTVTPKLDAVDELWRFLLLEPREEKRLIDINKKLLVRVGCDEKLAVTSERIDQRLSLVDW